MAMLDAAIAALKPDIHRQKPETPSPPLKIQMINPPAETKMFATISVIMRSPLPLGRGW